MIWSRFVKTKLRQGLTNQHMNVNVRMRVLDLSKVFIYEFHYDYIKNKHGNKPRLSFTDKTEDSYKDFGKDKDMCDFINYYGLILVRLLITLLIVILTLVNTSILVN